MLHGVGQCQPVLLTSQCFAIIIMLHAPTYCLIFDFIAIYNDVLRCDI